MPFIEVPFNRNKGISQDADEEFLSLALKKNNMLKHIFIVLSVALTFGACTRDYEKQLEKDIEKIQDYLDENGLVAESTESGLHYIIEVPGSGGHPGLTDEVTVHYKGYDLNGDVFDESGAQPIEFFLYQVIPGWQEGIPLFKKGGSGILLIPSGLAYGPNPRPGIEKNAVLIFEVELVNF